MSLTSLISYISNSQIIAELVNKIKNSNDLEEFIEYVDDRKYNDKRYNISFDKLTKLGWKQEIFIDEGLAKTIEYYKKNN